MLAVIEVVAVPLFAWRTGRGLRATELLPGVLAGAALLLAWRAATLDVNARRVAVCLLLDFAAHLIDLAQRWRR